MKKNTLLLCIVLVFLPFSFLFAWDFGLILDQTPGVGGYGSDVAIDYTGLLIPRFSTLVGERGEFGIAGGLRVDYLNETWIVVPELLRTEFSWRFNKGELKAGRMQYSDPLGFIADGLFDGARFSLDAKGGVFSVGAWYTGLLFQDRIIITMTGKELESYNTKTVYNDFANTYFAPRRIFSALEWEHPAYKELYRLKFALIGQFDVSGADLNTQYAVAKVSVPVKSFIFDLGGCVNLMEDSGSNISAKDGFGIGFAGELGAAWMLPTAIEDQLSFVGRFSSGAVEDSHFDAFLPISTTQYGDALKAKLSGISMLCLDYIGRFHRYFSVGITSSYFIRSDKATYHTYGTEGYFLGNEFFGRFLWNPSSDVQLNLGAGAFLPSLGNAAPDAKVLWRVELNLILSLY